jgi:hypothetical protein
MFDSHLAGETHPGGFAGMLSDILLDGLVVGPGG